MTQAPFSPARWLPALALASGAVLVPGSLIAPCAAQERVQRPDRVDRRAAEARRGAPTEFVRILRDRRDAPIAMQTAIARYVSADRSGDLVVDLIGVVHIADRDYYERLNIKFEQYDALLYELVAPEERRVPTPEAARESMNPLALVQKMAHGVLGLSSQLEHIDYTAENFVHADLSPAEMREEMRKRGDDGITVALGVMADMLRQMNLDEMRRKERPNTRRRGLDAFDPFAFLVEPGGSSKLKVGLAEQLAGQANGEALGQTLGKILVEDRNRAAMRVFQKQLAKGRKRIGIFYGAAHMPDFERRLKADFGLVRDRVSWLTAWDLKRDSGKTGLGSILELLGDELARDLRRGLDDAARRRDR